jgi:hypothetical protein
MYTCDEFRPCRSRKRGELPWHQHLQLSFLSRGRTAELAATWKTILRRTSTRLDHAQNLGETASTIRSSEVPTEGAAI